MGMRKGDIETQSFRNVRSEEQGIQAGLGVSCREGEPPNCTKTRYSVQGLWEAFWEDEELGKRIKESL